MIPRVLPALMVKPDFCSIAAQLSSWDCREEPSPGGAPLSLAAGSEGRILLSNPLHFCLCGPYLP